MPLNRCGACKDAQIARLAPVSMYVHDGVSADYTTHERAHDHDSQYHDVHHLHVACATHHMQRHPQIWVCLGTYSVPVLHIV